MSINPNTQYTLSGSQITDLRDYVQAAMESPSTLLGSTAPSSSTAADVGQLYLNTTNDKVYICTAKTAQGTVPETYLYTWEEVGGSGGSNITMSATDPGEGSALAADNYIAYYGGDPVVADYSTSEINTGATWIDGSPIYKKTFSFTNIGSATRVAKNHGISNFGTAIKMEWVYTPGSGYWLNGSENTNTMVEMGPTQVALNFGSSWGTNYTGHVTAYYTKSS